MNRQKFKIINGQFIRHGIEWTHVPNYRAFTANPIRGCQHQCRWMMPDKTLVICYAENGAEHSPAKIHYPGGFSNITFHPDVLDQIRSHKLPAAIFIDSMSDLMGKGVKDEWIEAVLETMRACPRHLFQLLTKNPGRLPHFQFPDNCWVGISAPPTFMFGHELTPVQQASWYDRGLEQLAKVNVPVRWTSIEPLSWDVSSIIRRHQATLAWAVIGAGTNGQRAYQPADDVFKAALDALNDTPVFFKGNIDADLADRVAGGWREEFPL